METLQKRKGRFDLLQVDRSSELELATAYEQICRSP